MKITHTPISQHVAKIAALPDLVLITSSLRWPLRRAAELAVSVALLGLALALMPAAIASADSAGSGTHAGTGRHAAESQVINTDDCNFTLYLFKDSSERLQAYLPPGYLVVPYGPPLVDGNARIAAAVYDCDRIEVPGSSPAPGTFTVLSVLVYPPGEDQFEFLNEADFYVLWVHANNPRLVALLASSGMPASLVPGMLFEKSSPLAPSVRTEVPWSPGPYELATTAYFQDRFHDHGNTYWHNAPDGRVVRMDFNANLVRDQFCIKLSDGDALPCGKLTAQAGTPIATFFGGTDRIAHDAYDHDPIAHSEFHLSATPPKAGAQSPSAGTGSPGGQTGSPGAEPSRASTRLTVRPKRAAVGRRARFTFRATTVASGTAKPLAGATVRFAGVNRRTNRSGVAHVFRRFTAPGRHTARLTGRGARPTSLKVRVDARR